MRIKTIDNFMKGNIIMHVLFFLVQSMVKHNCHVWRAKRLIISRSCKDNSKYTQPGEPAPHRYGVAKL